MSTVAPTRSEHEGRRPSTLDTELESDERDELFSRASRAPAPVRVAALDAEHLRNSVAARLFGAAAEPVMIGRFKVLKRLGAGGMGVVYAAYDNDLDRKIAIKLLRRVGRSSGKGETDPHMARLRREAQALAKLSHPNVVQVYEIGEFRQQTFVAMEFIEGETLRDWQPASTGKAAVDEILRVFAEAGRGLAAAHDAGLIHRDFKPDNAIVTADGHVVVLDFGLARGVDEEDLISSSEGSASERSEELLDSTSSSLRQPLTQTGAILGTPAYMAPEQHMGKRADGRSDQYAFCVALWEKLFGQRPFRASGIRELAVKVLDGDIDEPSDPPHPVPQWLRRAIERGMSVKPEQRWPDMPSLLEALAHDPRVRRRWVIAGTALLCAALAGMGWALTRETGPGPCEGGEDKLAGVWDTSVRDQVRGAFLATDTPYAQSAWEGTERRLDAYAQQWVGMHREVCEASLVRKEESPELFGRKMVCLGQRLTELEQLTKLLVAADEATVSRAVVAASGLARIESCAEERSLIGDSDDPRLEELERLLANASGSLALAKYDEGLATAKQAADLARRIGTAHGEGRALFLLGKLQIKKRKLDDGKASLRESLRRADVAGDDSTRVEALTQLMRVSYLEHDLEAGEALAADAQAALDRLGGAPLLEADFYLHFGSLALARGQNEAAGEYHGRALDIREAQLGKDHPEVAISLTNISNALRAQGDLSKSEQMARQALAIFEAQLGPDHPYTAASHNNIGNSLIEQGRHIAWDDEPRAQPYFEQAEDHYRKAVAIRQANFKTANHPSVALNLHNLGEAQRFQGHHEDARATLTRALEIKRNHLDADHPSIALTATALGRVLVALGELDEALKLLEPAAANREDGKGSSDAHGETFFAYAMALAQNPDQSEQALAYGQKALEAYVEAGEDYRGERQRVERWLAKREP